MLHIKLCNTDFGTFLQPALVSNNPLIHNGLFFIKAPGMGGILLALSNSSATRHARDDGCRCGAEDNLGKASTVKRVHQTGEHDATGHRECCVGRNAFAVWWRHDPSNGRGYGIRRGRLWWLISGLHNGRKRCKSVPSLHLFLMYGRNGLDASLRIVPVSNVTPRRGRQACATNPFTRV